MRDPLLPAAVLVAAGARLVIVGTAALMAHGEVDDAKDLDIVPDCKPSRLETLGQGLTQLAILGRAPTICDLGAADVLTLATSYGPVDLMMRRGREEFDVLWRRSATTCVYGVAVPIASAADAWRLRQRFKVTA